MSFSVKSMFIAAGLADLVMVLGVEKLNQPSGDEAILNMGTGVDREWEAAFGLTAPPCFALAAQAHMAQERKATAKPIWKEILRPYRSCARATRLVLAAPPTT